MVLPGRLTVAFLDEDNPLKSFFRMRPILTEDGGQFVPSNTDDRYPEEGFIRVVPDKNEIMMFKTRMRQMGRYCALDLRKHLGENDKIRPNKNYIFGGPEHSQYIVYSDVIGRVPPHLIAEVVKIDQLPEADVLMADGAMPGTVYVMVERQGEISGPWSWALGNGKLRLTHAQHQPFMTMPATALDGKVLDVPLPGGESVRLMHDLRALGLNELTAQEFENIVDGGMFGAAGLHSAVSHEPVDAPDQPSRDAAPWLSRNEVLRPPRFGNLRTLPNDGQTGLNPRRGRSLHEVVDEQWRKSRYDQELGHSMPSQAFVRPSASPAERAVFALREAWNNDDQREALLDEALKIDELRSAMCERLGVEPETRELGDQIGELEARRLALEGEIAELKQQSSQAKKRLMDEMNRAHADQIDAHKQRIAALRGELAQNESAANAARDAAKSAEGLLLETNEQLNERIKSAMLIDRVRMLTGEPNRIAERPQVYNPGAGELVTNVLAYMEQVGLEMDEDAVVNALACLMSGDAVIFSGPIGSGKTSMARELAAALGLASDRFVQVGEPTDVEAKALIDNSDGLSPVMVLIDDFNTGDCERRMGDIIALQESVAAKNVPLILMLTAQDAPEGKPLAARLLTRSFMIRLDDASAQLEWRPSAKRKTDMQPAASLVALRKAFSSNGDVPVALVDRLEKLRTALGKLNCVLDRRTLSALWSYCASALPLQPGKPLAVLDAGIAQRVMPVLMASMDIGSLRQLPELVADMPRSLALIDQPLPLPPL